jgi:hypothetical protein
MGVSWKSQGYIYAEACIIVFGGDMNMFAILHSMFVNPLS